MSTKHRIAQESLKLFNQYGLGRVGVRDIALYLKISPGNLSYHFPKKEDLVLYIIEEMISLNTVAFQTYLALSVPTLFDYLRLVKQLLLNNYQYRGITQEFVELSRILNIERFSYKEVEKSRLDIYIKIFKRLDTAKELQLNANDIAFLNSFMSLYGRIWVAEAFISFQHKSKSEIINYYLNFGARQFQLFATPKGKKSIRKFLETELL